MRRLFHPDRPIGHFHSSRKSQRSGCGVAVWRPWAHLKMLPLSESTSPPSTPPPPPPPPPPAVRLRLECSAAGVLVALDAFDDPPRVCLELHCHGDCVAVLLSTSADPAAPPPPQPPPPTPPPHSTKSDGCEAPDACLQRLQNENLRLQLRVRQVKRGEGGGEWTTCHVAVVVPSKLHPPPPHSPPCHSTL